jgi:hypothetical protein
MNTSVGGRLYEVVTFGSDFLDAKELKFCRDRLIAEYYNYLAVSVVQGRRERAFWDIHKKKLAEAGVQFSRLRVAASLLKRIARAVLDPRETVDKLMRRESPGQEIRNR